MDVAARGLGCTAFPDLFEGPEKTLTLCFRRPWIAAGSLRLIPQPAWAEVLKHAKCEILSVVQSGTLALEQENKQRAAASTGLTAYLLSESSLFVSDDTITLKTCGRTTPLAALEPLMDLAAPAWRNEDPGHYLKYATFARLGYIRPEEQVEPHTSWCAEVAHLDKYLQGEAVVLGSQATSLQHLYVANYLPRDALSDVCSTQVALTDLNTSESMRRYATGLGHAPQDANPLRMVWGQLHGKENVGLTDHAQLDERFFEPIGYSSNGVFGRHFTTVHVTPQPGCSYLSAETSLPLSRAARQRFILAAQGMCSSRTMVVTEFALCPKLLSSRGVPHVPGYEVRRSSQTVGDGFACAHHLYQWRAADCCALSPPLSPCSPAASTASLGRSSDGPLDVVSARAPEVEAEVRVLQGVPVFGATAQAGALVVAALHFLACPGDVPKDVPMALLDLAVLKRQAETWRRLLPRVEPFYAVKCNPHRAIVETLWSIWKEQGAGGFDCASPLEIELVASLGVDPAEHIIFANPCKQASAVTFARATGVRRTVFDNAAELAKLAELHPDAELLLRVQTDDSLAQCPLSNKFGAAPEDCKGLLARARALGLAVVGVSFHVGSGCSQPGAFRGALRRARAVFDEAEQIGFEMAVLDIGGGFPGWDEAGQAAFADHAADIRELLEELFPSPVVHVIAEPGRFLAATAQAMLATVVSVAEASGGERYYLNDGLYGSFNCLLYDHAVPPVPTILRQGRELTEADASTTGPAAQCTIFGPTCDGFDMITDSMVLPRLQVGDRLLFPHMGAYTSAASTSFNGFAPAAFCVYESELEQEWAPVAA